MKLQILTPDKIVYDGEVEALLVPGAAGPFEILKDHAPILSSLVAGELRVKKDRKEAYYAVSGGFIEFHANQATVLAEAAETPEEIDVKRVAAAKKRALDNLNNPAERTAAQKALARARVREKISEKIKRS
jgi:F-type H+-transporting ATPase subunit epsilon